MNETRMSARVAVRKSLPTAATIVDVRDDNYRTKTFTFDANLDGSPGQFVMAWLPRFDEKPFSLVNGDPVTLMITAVGPFSRLAHGLRAGDRLWLRGPFGHGFDVPATHRRIALVGGGYGIAPLLWLARAQRGRAGEVTAIIGARSRQDILYADRFSNLTSEPSAGTAYRLFLTTEDGSAGERGLVTERLRPMLEAGDVDGIYACGPHGMLAVLEALSRRHGVPCQLSWEAYMRCGIGVCGACEHNGAVLCMDGPVLRVDSQLVV